MDPAPLQSCLIIPKVVYEKIMIVVGIGCFESFMVSDSFPTTGVEATMLRFLQCFEYLGSRGLFFIPLLTIVPSLYEFSFVIPFVTRLPHYINFSASNGKEMSIHWVNPACMVIYKPFRIKSGIIVVSAKVGITKSGSSSSAK